MIMERGVLVCGVTIVAQIQFQPEQSGGGFFRKQMGLTALTATDALASILDPAIGFLAPHISADICRYGSCI